MEDAGRRRLKNNSAMDLSLDQIIDSRRGSHRKQVYRTDRYKTNKVFTDRQQRHPNAGRTLEVNEKWKHDLYNQSTPSSFSSHNPRISVTISNESQGFALHVSNLHYNVTEEDLHELFSTSGTILNVDLQYDRSGRSNGLAQVVFASRRDALAAIDRFHGVPLDGQPMVVEPAGQQPRGTFAPVRRVFVNKDDGFNTNRPTMSSRNSGFSRSSPTSMKDLDDELDAYMMSSK